MDNDVFVLNANGTSVCNSFHTTIDCYSIF